MKYDSDILDDVGSSGSLAIPAKNITKFIAVINRKRAQHLFLEYG